jgi:hypothetical protein
MLCSTSDLKTVTDTQKHLAYVEKSNEDFGKMFPKLLELSDKCSKDIW